MTRRATQNDSVKMDELFQHVPKDFRPLFTTIVGLTDDFCAEHLNDEYQQLCREITAKLCRKGTPLTSGRPRSWASGIVHALGWANFLSDPSQDPHMSVSDVAKGFGVSQGTMTAKSKTIRDRLRIVPFDPVWCLPSGLEDNPLVWMVETTSGFIIDIRHAPRQLKEEACRRGLIPFIPRDPADPTADPTKRDTGAEGGQK